VKKYQLVATKARVVHSLSLEVFTAMLKVTEKGLLLVAVIIHFLA